MGNEVDRARDNNDAAAEAERQRQAQAAADALKAKHQAIMDAQKKNK